MSVKAQLEKMSGLSEKTIDEIWEQVKANSARLASCRNPHTFVALETSGSIVRRWRCTRCNGEIDAINKIWYEKGLEHGRKLTP